MHMLRAVGFDLDDTLAVPRRDRATLLREACRAVDAPPLPREEYVRAHDADIATETRAPIFAAILAEYGVEVDPEALATAYRERVEAALEPVPGATALVEHLREDYRAGLLTDGPLRAQRGKLERLGWAALFDAVVITGGLPAGKPDPGAFEALLAELDAAPGEAAYVGDHPRVDIAGATDVGLYAVQVTYEGGPDPHPGAAATVPREVLAERLPDVLTDLDG